MSCSWGQASSFLFFMELICSVRYSSGFEEIPYVLTAHFLQLFQQFVIACSQAVPDTTELRPCDVLYSSFNFDQSFPCHVQAPELEHTDKLCLPDSLFFSDTADISANINANLFDFLFHAKVPCWTKISPVFLYLTGME